MKLATNIGILFSLIFVKSLTPNQCDQLNLLVADLTVYLVSLSDLVSSLYSGGKCFLYSTGTHNFESFSADLTKHLQILDYKRNIEVYVSRVQNGYVRNTVTNNLDRIHLFIESHIHDILEETLCLHSENEKKHIAECLKGDSFFNLTTVRIPDTTLKYMEKGGKYNPYTIKSNSENLALFDKEFAAILNNMLRWIIPKQRLIDNRDIVNSMNALKLYFLGLELDQNATLVSELIQKYVFERQLYKTDLVKGVYFGQHCDVPKKQLDRLFNFDPNVIFLEGDKNVGFVCMTIKDLLFQYDKINKEQCFEKVEIEESEYLSDITSYVRNARIFLPNELANIIPKRCFKLNILNPSLGSLRLMPKVLKLKTIAPESVPFLKCRGIKSSMSDPIKSVQLALDHVFNHIIFYQEKHFVYKFGRNSPSVTGVDEAIFRHKKTKVGPFGHSLEVEADFGNLYSFCNMDLLKHHVAKGLKLAKITDASKDYIFNLIEVEMTRSYFKEPSGIYRTLLGFSMGDHAVARGSEVILFSCEIDTYFVLVNLRVISVVKEHDRFRDDIKIHVSGRLDMMLCALRSIIEGYPKEITLNVKTGIITGNFLNIRIYSDPTVEHPCTSILRKQHSRYNIIPPDSNTVDCFKKCAGQTYYRMADTHCSTYLERCRQKGIIRLILELKGFSRLQILKMKNRRKKRKETASD